MLGGHAAPVQPRRATGCCCVLTALAASWHASQSANRLGGNTGSVLASPRNTRPPCASQRGGRRNKVSAVSPERW